MDLEVNHGIAEGLRKAHEHPSIGLLISRKLLTCIAQEEDGWNKADEKGSAPHSIHTVDLQRHVRGRQHWTTMIAGATDKKAVRQDCLRHQEGKLRAPEGAGILDEEQILRSRQVAAVAGKCVYVDNYVKNQVLR